MEIDSSDLTERYIIRLQQWRPGIDQDPLSREPQLRSMQADIRKYTPDETKSHKHHCVKSLRPQGKPANNDEEHRPEKHGPMASRAVNDCFIVWQIAIDWIIHLSLT